MISPFEVKLSCLSSADRKPPGSAEGQRETAERPERQSEVFADGHLQHRHRSGNTGGGSFREGTPSDFRSTPDRWSKVALTKPDSKSTDRPQADLTNKFEHIFIVTVQFLSIYNI